MTESQFFKKYGKIIKQSDWNSLKITSITMAGNKRIVCDGPIKAGDLKFPANEATDFHPKLNASGEIVGVKFNDGILYFEGVFESYTTPDDTEGDIIGDDESSESDSDSSDGGADGAPGGDESSETE